MSGTHDSHEPTTLPEPKTPMWLPALGAVLFLAVGLLWALGDNPDPAAPATTAAPHPPSNPAAAIATAIATAKPTK